MYVSYLLIESWEMLVSPSNRTEPPPSTLVDPQSHDYEVGNIVTCMQSILSMYVTSSSSHVTCMHVFFMWLFSFSLTCIFAPNPLPPSPPLCLLMWPLTIFPWHHDPLMWWPHSPPLPNVTLHPTMYHYVFLMWHHTPSCDLCVVFVMHNHNHLMHLALPRCSQTTGMSRPVQTSPPVPCLTCPPSSMDHQKRKKKTKKQG